MLVKEEIVDSWYNKNSKVYKHFSFLFVNPLWAKPVPTGFSVCPYFWLAVVSFCVVRPLVTVAMLLARLFKNKSTGQPGHSRIHNALYQCLRPFYPKEILEVGQKDLGFALAMNLLTILVTAVLVVRPVTKIIGLLLSTTNMLAISSVAVLSMGLLYVSCICAYMALWYMVKTEAKRCNIAPATVWLYGLFLLTSVVMNFGSVLSTIWYIVSSIGFGIKATLWFIGSAFATLVGWIVAAVAWMLKIVWAFVSFAPFGFVLPWWLYFFGIAAVLYWVSEKLFDRLLCERLDVSPDEMTPEDIRIAANRRAWHRMITGELSRSTTYDNMNSLLMFGLFARINPDKLAGKNYIDAYNTMAEDPVFTRVRSYVVGLELRDAFRETIIHRMVEELVRLDVTCPASLSWMFVSAKKEPFRANGDSLFKCIEKLVDTINARLDDKEKAKITADPVLNRAALEHHYPGRELSPETVTTSEVLTYMLYLLVYNMYNETMYAYHTSMTMDNLDYLLGKEDLAKDDPNSSRNADRARHTKSAIQLVRSVLDREQDLVKEIKKVYAFVVDDIRREQTFKALKESRWQESPLKKRCEALHQWVGEATTKTKAVWTSTVWAFLKASWQRLKAAGRFLRGVISWMWIYLKSKKTKACPYKRFY